MLKFYQQKGKDGDVAVFSQVTLYRNLRDLPFTARLDAEKAKALLEKAEKALLDAGLSFTKYDFTELSPTKRGVLAENGLVPQSFVSGASPRGVFVSEDESVSVIVGDEDHIRILAQRAGLDLSACLEQARSLDAVFDAAFGYAFSEKYGYLTASPVHLGNAMIAGVAVHLPAIAASSGLRALSAQIGRMGYELTALYGEGSGVYLLSNVKSLGITEKELLAGIESAAGKIMERERALRGNLYKENPEYLENRVYRALAILGSARVISMREAAALLSDARLGAGVLSDVEPEKLDALYRLIGPCAVSEAADDTAKTEVRRAKLLRDAIR